ncbi:acyl carrier protein [Streptomyces sp. JNUCC 64]
MSVNANKELSPELRARVREIVADVLEVDTDEVGDHHSFSEDFEADSLLIIEMYSRFEKNLGIEIPQDDLVDLDDLGTAYSLIAQHATAPAHV